MLSSFARESHMFNIGVQAGNQYLLIVVSGEATVPEIQAMTVFVGELVTRTGRRRILLDSLSFESARDDAAKSMIAAHMRETIPQLERVAILVRSDARRGFIQGAAQGREFEAREFSDIVEAENWLA